jgi:hypothetical protein
MMLRPRSPAVGHFLRGLTVFNKVTGGYLGGVVSFAAGGDRRGLPCGLGSERAAAHEPASGSFRMKIKAIFAVFNLPDGASMERTDQLMKRAEAD